MWINEGSFAIFLLKEFSKISSIEIPFDIITEIVSRFLELSVNVRNYIACGYASSSAVAQNTLFVWGDSHTRHSLYTPMQSPLTDIIALYRGFGQHSFALTKSGLYGWGSNTAQQIIGGKDSHPFIDFNYPRLLSIPFSIKDIRMTKSRTFALSTDGELYYWGGYSDTIKLLQLPLIDGKSQKVQMLSTSESNCLVLSDLNNLYIGSGRNLSIEFNFIMNDEICAIASGLEHYLVLTKKGELLTWGNNSFSQLGLGKDTERVSSDTIHKVDLSHLIQGYPNLEKINSISCGGYQSMIVLSNGDLIVWGANYHHQLGLGDEERRHSPQLHPDIHDIIAIASGHRNSVVITKNDFIVFGSNQSGQMGVTSTSHDYAKSQSFDYPGTFPITYNWEQVFAYTNSLKPQQPQQTEESFVDIDTNNYFYY